MLRYAVVLVLLAAAPAAAQVYHRPTAPPIVTAENDTWYRTGEPVQLDGNVYYRAGGPVFFDGNVMVRTGHYKGVPLYADTTLEPYSMVFVAIGRGLMQRYELPRRGEVAGTTGSRAPSFAVALRPESGMPMRMAPAPPTNLPVPMEETSAYTPDMVFRPGVSEPISRPMPEPEARPEPVQVVERFAGMELIRKPENNDGIWIRYKGSKWVSAGPAVQLRSTDFRMVGDYAGFPVYVRQNDTKTRTIYLPTRANLVAPYRLK
jgi:hypothetical protein